MLTLLKIKNIALIDELAIEFGDGLNLLTGETGSGKSIIVDSLDALTGNRVSGDLIKQGEDSARIEGLFWVDASKELLSLLDESGIEIESSEAVELIIRRELSLSGKNRVFVNNQLVTQGFLKGLGPMLADIHGQGEQASLYDIETHIEMLDDFAAVDKEKAKVAVAFNDWSTLKSQLATLEKDESEKLQLLDILRFQVNEIKSAALTPGEDTSLEEEKRRLNNTEKLSALSSEAHSLLYDDELSTLATLDRSARIIAELAEYDARFRGFDEGLNAARAVIDELGSTARDFSSTLEFSPERLDEIENRLNEIVRLKRKYGETIEAVLEHLRVSDERLQGIEMAEFREEELKKHLDVAADAYMKAASVLHDARTKAALKFSKAVEQDLQAVALEKAKFEVRFTESETFSANGNDIVEFYFSANPGEPPRPLAKVASGGEASRLMLILKTVAKGEPNGKTAVFDEIDIGIGGRVAEAVGRKLKDLAASQQVFCVTHQPQIASLADRHFVVEKTLAANKTRVTVRELDASARVDEIARMLAGEQITDAARENARTMLAAAGAN
ncbi:MAG: DNA repair protein RecN [Pyrinomonadaceae bacterium]|nr:DNA repair protein RecN [Pyrinomonadaceae bacterium]MBP9109203.1 DNA repair protein RecN [Pyrinomonadaceae bacterium]